MNDQWVIENSALCLRWQGGRLQVENRLSGLCRAFDFPAFMIRLGDVEIPADLFERTGVEPGEDEISFHYRHETTGIQARALLDRRRHPLVQKTADASGAGQSGRANAGPALGGHSGRSSTAHETRGIRRPRRARRGGTDRARLVRTPGSGLRVSGVGG